MQYGFLSTAFLVGSVGFPPEKCSLVLLPLKHPLNISLLLFPRGKDWLLAMHCLCFLV